MREDQKLDLLKKRSRWQKLMLKEWNSTFCLRKALKAKVLREIVFEVLDHKILLANHKPEDRFNFMDIVCKLIPSPLLIQKYGYMNSANMFFVPI